MTAAPGAAPPGPRRGRWAALVVLAAAVTGASTLPTWVTAYVSTALEGEVAVAVAGSRVAPQVVAAALALLASSAALALVGRVGRVVVGLVVAGCGALVGAAALAVLRDPAAAAANAVAERTGVDPAAPDAGAGLLPWLATAVGVLVVLLGLALSRAPGPWSQRSRRHEVPGATSRAARPDPGDGRDDWDALSRGDDPT
ncbi:Trp biosynthesis-associated membrane protein [Cellulomonas sp.]|uniref:Trp biosynthesis-associated membrane protein n=1 Tax=Cellulomonas sp. TaxID=40001 RepID=UPI0028125B69|nr:Trp biosynthesis-associated membrane protein [Cellulomonas sp.]